jgi:hypothetical protein
MMKTCEAPRVVWQGHCGTPEEVEAWRRFMRAADAFHGRLARERGAPYTPMREEELEAAATLATALGLTPAAALAWLPATSHS